MTTKTQDGLRTREEETPEIDAHNFVLGARNLVLPVSLSIATRVSSISSKANGSRALTLARYVGLLGI